MIDDDLDSRLSALEESAGVSEGDGGESPIIIIPADVTDKWDGFDGEDLDSDILAFPGLDS